MSASFFGERGSATVEGLLALPIIAAVLMVGGSLLYISFSKAWLTRTAREAAICLVTPTPPLHCRRKTEATLATGLPIGRVELVEFHANQRGSRVSLRIELPDALTRLTPTGSPALTINAAINRPVFFPRE